MKQTTNSILMIRPINFRGNEQTFVNNYFQNQGNKALPAILNLKAQQEFDALVEKLQSIGVDVIVVNDTDDFDTPDAIFPNNWISFHENATLAIYPMFAENRRYERREDILDQLEQQGFLIKNIIDYSSAEDEDVFLEGTGSVVLDRENRKAYCALSPRSNEDLFIEFCEDFEFSPVIFKAYQTVEGIKKAIYHTNVMMCIAETFAVICLESILDKKERKTVINHLKENNKEIISITAKQMNCFAGNMLQVIGKNKQTYLVMSESAYSSLTNKQIDAIEKYSKILYTPLPTIEKYGGGSARCMMAEVFLPQL